MVLCYAYFKENWVCCNGKNTVSWLMITWRKLEFEVPSVLFTLHQMKAFNLHPGRSNPGGLNIMLILCIFKPGNLATPQATLPFKWRLLRNFQATETWILPLNRADSKFVPSQWEKALLCNDVFHWLGANPELALIEGYLSTDSVTKNDLLTKYKSNQVSEDNILLNKNLTKLVYLDFENWEWFAQYFEKLWVVCKKNCRVSIACKTLRCKREKLKLNEVINLCLHAQTHAYNFRIHYHVILYGYPLP